MNRSLKASDFCVHLGIVLCRCCSAHHIWHFLKSNKSRSSLHSLKVSTKWTLKPCERKPLIPDFPLVFAHRAQQELRSRLVLYSGKFGRLRRPGSLPAQRRRSAGPAARAREPGLALQGEWRSRQQGWSGALQEVKAWDVRFCLLKHERSVFTL